MERKKTDSKRFKTDISSIYDKAGSSFFYSLHICFLDFLNRGVDKIKEKYIINKAFVNRERKKVDKKRKRFIINNPQQGLKTLGLLGS